MTPVFLGLGQLAVVVVAAIVAVVKIDMMTKANADALAAIRGMMTLHEARILNLETGRTAHDAYERGWSDAKKDGSKS